MMESLGLDSLTVALAVAFIFGMGARLVALPPMVGFLLAGFVLHSVGVDPRAQTETVAELGVFLLLFTIGLKLEPSILAKRQVLGSALGHMAIFCVVFGSGFLLLGVVGLWSFAGLSLAEAAILAFALSFSSTVFAVKVFDEKGELGSVHGKTAIGILIVQDLAAVVFLTASTGKLPSPWAVGLIGLVALRPLIARLLDRLGHGELLPLFGLFAVVVLGAASFEVVGLKPDLGALALGLLMANHPRAKEVADSLIGFKEIFLIGFFLNIGLAGLPSAEAVLSAFLLVALLVFKLVLFFAILVALRLRARSALLAGLGLGTYSEFGLIVVTTATAAGWLGSEWLLILALALALSFLIFAPINVFAHDFYARWGPGLRRFEAPVAEREDVRPALGQAEVVIFGMGRLGSAVYGALEERLGAHLLGIETDAQKVARLQDRGWTVAHGDATDSDFWARATRPSARLRAVLLAMPEHDANLYALEQIRAQGYDGFVAALARYPDQITALEDAGADIAFDVYGEAGRGFAADVAARLGGSGRAAEDLAPVAALAEAAR